MPSYWNIGINESVSTPGNQVALMGYFFADVKNGNDTTGDGSPGNPYATHTKLAQNHPNNCVWVLGSGTYNNNNAKTPQINNVSIIANIPHTVILRNTSLSVLARQFNASSRCSVDGVWFIEGYFGNISDPQYKNCIFQLNANSSSSEILANTNENGISYFEKCIFISSGIKPTRFETKANNGTLCIKNCTFYGNCSVTENANVDSTYNMEIINSDCSSGSTITFSDFLNTNTSFINHCNFRGTQTNSTAGDLITTLNNINVDPGHNGNPDLGQFLISGSSALIGSGENGVTIGAFKRGEILDLTNPTENNNLTLTPKITINSGFANGNVKVPFVFSTIETSPVFHYNGIVNALNTPDATPLRISNDLTFLLSYKTNTGDTLSTEQPFRWNQPLTIDTDGNSNGSDAFNKANEIPLNVISGIINYKAENR